jgi:hypothetical protein
LGPIEEELEEIGSSGNFENYENFLETYSDFALHPNHYLLMTAARNLIQVDDDLKYWAAVISYLL